MGPRKSASEWSSDTGYPNVLQRLCQEEDVLIVPQFVTIYTGRQSAHVSPRARSKDSRIGEHRDISSVVVSESRDEDLSICGSIRPPQVGIIYSNPDDKETPVAVVCKNIYIEYTLINAFGKSLKPYPTISTLKIENCCISKEIAEALAFLLADEPGKWISELSLDGNEGVSEMLPLFVRLPTGVKYLSLKRCSLVDEDVEMLAEALAFTDEKDHKLLVLNLGMNKIGNAGAAHLAKGLRTNRALASLSLSGNQIEDEGAFWLCEVVRKFPLTYEEVVLRRRRIFDRIFVKKAAVERYLEEMRSKTEEGNPSSKTNVKNNDRLMTAGRKIRGQDGKVRCVTSRDQRVKASVTKTNSGEKFRGKVRGGGDAGAEPTPSEILAVAQQVESETPPDKHPFTNEVVTSEDELWCLGCWSLASLNLSFNSLTEATARNFAEAPGNRIPENSDEFQALTLALARRSSKKDGTEDVSSVTSARRISSSGRRMKNR